MTFRGYAKQRGASPEAVSKAVRSQRISTIRTPDGRRLIDPEVADREWAANTRASLNFSESIQAPSITDFDLNDILDMSSFPPIYQSRSKQLDFIAQRVERLGRRLPQLKTNGDYMIVFDEMLKLFDNAQRNETI